MGTEKDLEDVTDDILTVKHSFDGWTADILDWMDGNKEKALEFAGIVKKLKCENACWCRYIPGNYCPSGGICGR